MDSVRWAQLGSVPERVPCCRCGSADRSWDRIVGKAYCPNCQEQLAVGEGEPLVEKTEPKRCAVCGRAGTVCFQTFPLHAGKAVAIDLCAEHVRGLVARGLGPYAYHQLRRQLQALGLGVEELFLLHSAFYDAEGRALHPAVEAG